MTSPETLELEAVDAALAGRYVAPEHAELADLALLLRDERPQPTAEWATHLDRRVASGFPGRPKRRRDWSWLRTAVPVGAVASLLLIVIVAGALSGGGDDDAGSIAASGQSGASEDAGAGGGAAAPETATSGGMSRDSTAPLERAARPRKQERSVSMTLAAPRRQIDGVANQISNVTAQLGGYVARSSITSTRGGDLQLEVPTSRLDTLVQRLSKVAKVRELSRTSRDITAVVVSARERLNDARAERTSLLRQLANAVTVNETESIRARLRIVRREIAVYRNQLRHANNRANFADVAVTLVAARNSSDDAGGAWTPGDAWHDALRVLEVVAGIAVIAAAVAVPLLVAWLLGWLARRSVTRRRRERALDMA